MNYRLSDGTFITLGREIGRGGEATVYEIVGKPLLVAKIYHRPLDANHRQKLPWMISNPPSDPSAPTHKSFAWPSGMITLQGKGPVGFVMPHVTEMKKLVELYSPLIRKRYAPNWSLLHLTRTSKNLSTAVEFIHKADYVIGDLNESNVLVGTDARVTLIDTDSFQVRIPQSSGTGLLVPCRVGKPEFLAPELQGHSLSGITRTQDHDNFSLGVLIYLLLVGGNHPYRVLWTGPGAPPSLEEAIQRGFFPANHMSKHVSEPVIQAGFSTLSPAIQTLFKRSFSVPVTSDQRRPTSAEWQVALTNFEASLIECSNKHTFYSGCKTCPYCVSLDKSRNINSAGQSPQITLGIPQASPASSTPVPSQISSTHLRRGKTSRRGFLAAGAVAATGALYLWNTVRPHGSDYGSVPSIRSENPSTSTNNGYVTTLPYRYDFDPKRNEPEIPNLSITTTEFSERQSSTNRYFYPSMFGVNLPTSEDFAFGFKVREVRTTGLVCSILRYRDNSSILLALDPRDSTWLLVRMVTMWDNSVEVETTYADWTPFTGELSTIKVRTTDNGKQFSVTINGTDQSSFRIPRRQDDHFQLGFGVWYGGEGTAMACTFSDVYVSRA